ncbi:MAG TPA: flagellar motor protein [Bryobacteraceae bacterium]|nr:flagellar motor protein [Bryobacteraceae bacterium]
MAAAAAQQPQKTPEPVKPAEKAASTGAGLKPDLATLAGIALAFGGIIGGLVLEKGKIQDIVQMTAAMIVLGGTFGAVLVTMPLPVVIGAFQSLRSVFFDRSVSPRATIDALIQYATKARKNGIVSLEAEANTIPDPFLRKALNLAVDGTDLQELRKMMETDIALSEQAGEAEAKVWEAAGGYAPTIGIIGAVLGLIQVMKHLEDIKEVGHGIAVAFVATVYGVGSANIFFLPMGNKLRVRLRAAVLLKEMTLEGVIGIVEGLNPTLIRLKLDSYDPQPAKPKKAGSGQASEGAKSPTRKKGEK